MKNEIEFKFGDYAIIEQKRHGVPNEMFVHKVVGQLRSNTWVDVPVRVPATETLHGEMEDICLCICCGIDETEVRRYRVKDMRRHSPVSLVADEKRGSTITQQAVNELIQSLESAGELSIKERKYLELAKAYLDVAAENAFILQLMHEQAGCFNAALIEGFHELVMESGSEGLIDVYQRRLQPAIQCVPPTPATDRIVAEAEARGVDKLAMRRRAAAKVALDEFNDVKNHAELESEAWRAEMFAAELREGADK